MKDKALTDLILEVFRLNGRLLTAGDALVADLGLTSARWQVMGAIATAAQPLPVAHLARAIGVSRQAVQRIANELEAESLVAFVPNPLHRRAKLAMFTPRGQELYDAALQRQGPWADEVSRGLTADDIASTTDLLKTLRERLEASSASASHEASR